MDIPGLSEAGYRPPSGAKAIRTAGSDAEEPRKAAATSVALLIELKAAKERKLKFYGFVKAYKSVKWSIRVVKVFFAI